MILNFLPIISILASILIINGFFNLSYKSSTILERIIPEKNKFFLTIINFFLITNLLSVCTYIYLLFYEFNINIMQFLSILIIFFGLYKPSYLKSFLHLFKKNDYKLYLIYLFLFFYFLLSLSPITDPDSLDYHITLPLYQLNFQSDPILKYWLTSQLAGAGESIFLYGLSIKAINFSQILQFFSLFLLILFITNFKNNDWNFDNNKKYFVALCILLMPVLLFLTSTSKPQLYPIVTNFISLIICTLYLPKLKAKKSVTCFAIIISLLVCSTQFKFSFFLSSGLIIGLALYEMNKKKLMKIAILIILLISAFLILPREVYEFLYLKKDIFYNFFNPITDLYSAENYNNSLKHGPGNPPYFPIWIFLPYPNLNAITYCLGITSLYFIFNFNLKKKITTKISIISILFIILALLFAQPVGRFFIEPFVWLLFFSIFYFKKRKNFLIKYFNNLILVLSVIYIIILSYYSVNLFKGNFNEKFYESVLTKNADGYLLYKWANKVIPDNSVIISSHRSIAFYKYKAISYNFRLFTNSRTENGFKYYLNEILKEKPSYILYTSTEFNNKLDIFKNCRGELFKYKSNVGYTTGRSPLFKKESYDGLIFHIDLNKLKNCKL